MYLQKMILKKKKTYFEEELGKNRNKTKEISNVSEEDVKKILLSLDTSIATGMHQIPAKFLRDGDDALALLLRNIINLSIRLSNFPEECKIAKLKPIFKKRFKD